MVVAFLPDDDVDFWLGRVAEAAVPPNQEMFGVTWLSHASGCACPEDGCCLYEELFIEPEMVWRPSILAILKPQEFVVQTEMIVKVRVHREVVGVLQDLAETARAECEEDVGPEKCPSPTDEEEWPRAEAAQAVTDAIQDGATFVSFPTQI